MCQLFLIFCTDSEIITLPLSIIQHQFPACSQNWNISQLWRIYSIPEGWVRSDINPLLFTSLLVLTDWVSSGNIPRYLVQAELYVYIIILLLSFCNYQQISASKSYSAICFHGLESTQSQEQNIGISIFRQSFKLDTEHFHFRFDEIPPGVFCFIKTIVFK